MNAPVSQAVPNNPGTGRTRKRAGQPAHDKGVRAGQVAREGEGPANAVAVVATQERQPALSESAQVLMTINQMARDPTLNVDKMTALQAMHRELVVDQRRVEFFDALAQLATALPAIKKDGRLAIEKNGKLIQNTPYATWENLHRSVMPVLSGVRFALMHQTENAGDGLLRVKSTLSRNGHSESTFYDLPIDASGSKNNVQGRGSSTSYGKRYNTINLLNIRTEGEDTDGAFVGGAASAENAVPLIDPKVADAMVDLINTEYPDQEEAARIQRIKFAGRMSVPTIHHIAEKDVNDAWKILNAWKSTRAEKKRARHEHQTNAGDVLK